MKEINEKQCKVCLEIKVRVQDERFPNGKDKRWVDPSGSYWNGKICPPCNQERVKNTMRKIRKGRRNGPTIEKT